MWTPKGLRDIYDARKPSASTRSYPATASSHLLSFHHVKLYSFSISYTAQIFPWVILLDGSLSREEKILNDVYVNTDDRFHRFQVYWV